MSSGFAVWLTGLPASGKTTLARGLADALEQAGLPVQVLDSDHLRRVLTPDPTYSWEERDWFYRVMAFIGQLLVQNGVNVIFAATACRRSYRGHARAAIDRFIEVYVDCPLETCMARDEKGIYKKALQGEATTVPGLQVPYEVPEHPEVRVDTGVRSPAEGVEVIVDRLKDLGWDLV
jgi:adenylylsulfate kinase